MRRTTLTGAAEKARTDYAEAKESKAESARQSPGGAEDGMIVMGDVAGLGDQAWQSVTVGRANGVTEVQLVIRRANVLVEVEHSARRPKEQVVAAADALAREALHRLDVR
ncbi:hypothetical protein [Actinomadura sp. 7K507]|uniref:hypothetical protein n=1 Tax=Actinomadura sp. 7K507 TaxID=2530365 RepID=UPI0010462CB4|nr:hypothetical protein [Actinomadura sp. 7K507]TDC78208.1 hypothetical protein E1285_37685 [Actinomadura sp. 7K507]